MIIDYDNLDKKLLTTIKAIENKGHVLFIRYLISKRIPPETMRKELARLSLSAPSKNTIVVYFENIILPLAAECGIAEYYKEYYERLTKGTRETSLTPILNFKLSFEDKEADRIAFCTFIRELEIEEMWSREIVRHYGGIHNLPQTDKGERIIKVVHPRNVENILTSPRKFIIDKLLLENVTPARISQYMLERYELKFQEADIYTYMKYFFNFKRKDMEELLEQLVNEQTSVKNDLDIVYNDPNLSLGDKAAISKQYEEKLRFLDETIKDLNAKYTDLTFTQGVSERLEMTAIVEDIIQRGYERFKSLDRSRDRDVVKPLTEVSKMIFSAVDKKQQIETHKMTTEKTVLDRNTGAKEVLQGMYLQSLEEYIKEKEDEVPIDEIDGLED